jgi:hypothetical protein
LHDICNILCDVLDTLEIPFTYDLTDKCEIIDIKENGKNETPEYYVHYLEFNRRLDEWVEADRFDMNTIEERDKEKLKEHKYLESVILYPIHQLTIHRTTERLHETR